MKQIVTAILAAVSISAPAIAQHSNITQMYDPGIEMQDHPLDFTSMRLAVEFVPENGLVKGVLNHYFTPLRDEVDSFFLDGPGISVKSAGLNGASVKYKTTDDGIWFYPAKPLHDGEQDSMTIEYEAYPRKGIYFIGWNDPNNLSRKQIWTQGEGIDNRNWFPCYDHANDKLITELIVKFKKGYKVLSNGTKLEEKDLGDGNILWHYKMTHPHASYLVMLGIGKYDVHESRSASGVPLYQWYYPEWKDRFNYTYQCNEKVFNFLEQEIGVPYGWESYSQIPVQDFMFGAMENTTATIYGDFFEVDGRSYNDRNYVSVNAHELAHQWFGDLVTGRAGNCMWLQESFATHYNLLAERECFGDDHFDWARHQAYVSAIYNTDKKSISHSQTPTANVYQKGSVVLEMLKTITGRDGFNRAIKHYLEMHKYGNVDGNELLDAFQDQTGMSLQWFWDEWVYRGGEPDYKVSFDDIRIASGRFSQFIVTQAQPTNEVMGLFKMPIKFEVHYADGSTDEKTAWIEKESQVVRIPNSRGVDVAYVLFDPNNEVLKTVTFDKPFDMLCAQALKAPHMMDRYDALVALRSVPIEQKRGLLKQVYHLNTFHAIKSEIATQLMDDQESEELVRAALHDKDVQVHKDILLNTKKIRRSLEPDFASLLTDSSYVSIATALEKLCYNFPENTNKYLDASKGIIGTNGRNVEVKWLELSINNKWNTKELNQLINYTSQSYEFMTRTNAMSALKRLNYFDEAILGNCINACMSTNGRLSGPANETIKYFFAQDKYKHLIVDGIAKANVSAKDKAMLSKITE